MGGVAIEMRVVLIEFGVVFIGGWGYLTQYTRFKFGTLIDISKY